MKAIRFLKYGAPIDVLRVREIDTPPIGDGEVLVRVRAAGIQAGDWHLVRGLPYVVRMMGNGLLRPKSGAVGSDVAGVVEAVGEKVSQFEPGQEVFGWCEGGIAEYACCGEDNLVAKPEASTFEQAATVPSSGFTALQGLRDHGEVRPGHRVLINGASGGVGHFAVQIAKALGAEVTGVCSTGKVDMVRSLGADHVVDYTLEDFTRSDRRVDAILDMIGNHSLAALRRVLSPGGTLVVVGTTGGPLLQGASRFIGAALLSRFVSQALRSFVAAPSRDDLVVLQELMESGKLVPVIDRRYSLEEAPEAIAFVEEGHTRGKVVIDL